MYEFIRQSIRAGLVGLVVLFAVMTCSATPLAFDRDRQSETFAVLPEGSTGPEGLAVGPDGNVYATTFGFNKDGPTVEPGHLLVFNPDGKLIREVTVKGATPHLIGLAFNPITTDLIVLDFGAGVALKVDPVTGSTSVFMTVSGNALVNGVTFDGAGNVYVSDSAQGIIWKTGPRGGSGAVWASDALLRTAGFPPFGANGIEFNNSGDALFVANTGNNTILKIGVTNGVPGKPQVLANSVTSADGIAVDRNDNIWVASNQGDEIIVLDSTGKLLARLGKFQGIDEAGAPRGLLFPASPAFSPDQKTLYVSNLSLDVRLLGLGQTVDSQWASKVRRYTISKLPARIPLLSDGNGEGSK